MIANETFSSVRQGNKEHPLSWFQERLWLLHQKNPNDLAYNIPIAFLIEGPLNVPAFSRSLRTILERHQCLRARFFTTSRGEPAQEIAPSVDLELSAIPAAGEELAHHIELHQKHVFDLSTGPVVVARLLRLEAEKHLFLLNVHHIVADGWSIEGILFAELQTCYEAYSTGGSPKLPTLAMQYGDFASWQRNLDVTRELNYWQESLSGYESSLELPSDFRRTPSSGSHSATLVKLYPKEFSQRLDEFSQAHGCTLFMSLFAALGLVVNRYTGKNDLCLGTTTSGRMLPELEALIGFFINILPLRIQVEDDMRISEYMESVRRLTLGGFDHQAIPYERILYSLGMGTSNALLPVVLRHQNFPHTRMDAGLPGGVRFSPCSDDQLAQLAGKPLDTEGSAARCELELSFTGTKEKLEVSVVFASDVYLRDTVEQILRHHERVLRSMFDAGDCRIGDLAMLTAEELPGPAHIPELTGERLISTHGFVRRFDELAMRSPTHAACVDEGGEWSYAELAFHANRLARTLLSAGVQRGDVIGVCLHRGAPMLVAFLAIWKAGAAYLPLDPSYPEAYLGQILSDASPKLTLCTATTRDRLGLPDAQCHLIDVALGTPISIGTEVSSVVTSPDDLAYLMYTSGSTGVPKGVRVPHRQLANWLSGIEACWPFGEQEVIAQKTTMAFAVSVKEIFAGFLNGCRTVFIDAATSQDSRALAGVLQTYRVTRLNLVPSHLEALLKHIEAESLSLPALKYCIAAGEPLTSELVLMFRRLLPHATLLNNYGCTELNDVTYFDTSDFTLEQGFVPIGKPIQNTHLYVLDRQGRPVPRGVSGELHVASVGMPDGYHRRDGLNAERFVLNRFDEELASRIFNTGDVVRYLPNGNLEYIGRWDFQVKVRGFRVDVRHVEKVIGEFPGIAARAVVGANNQLHAYYVVAPGKTVDLGVLREYLQGLLPPYMVPSAFVAVDALPRLPNGKMDRASLRPSLGRIQRSDHYEAPRTPLERELTEIWSQVLELGEDEIGCQTHFFEVGGHSLSAVRVVARIKERLGIEIGLSQVFEHPRLGDLAVHVAEAREIQGVREDDPGAWFSQSEPASGKASRLPGLLEGKVVLVTGSSRGIGSAAVRLLAQHGAKVAINYVQSEVRAKRVRDLILQDGGTAEAFQADVTDPEQVDRLISDVRKQFGRIDVLVANAAIGFRLKPFVDYPWSDFERKLNDELKSIFYLAQAVVPEMLERKSGSIIAVSSTMSKTSTSGFIAHSTAKAALDAFVRGLAFELGPDGIRVNTVAPGLTLTDATANLSHQRKDAAATQSPLRRNGLPRDVAGAILFLASDLSQFMTGSYLPVDGGATML
jgi:amino acid adenylation domain-containing protein